jgi:hypothetical protein
MNRRGCAGREEITSDEDCKPSSAMGSIPSRRFFGLWNVKALAARGPTTIEKPRPVIRPSRNRAPDGVFYPDLSASHVVDAFIGTDLPDLGIR